MALHRALSSHGVYGAALLSALSLGLLAARFHVSGHPWFAFLVLNLVLAWVPLAMTLAAHAAPRLRPALFVPWLAFLPNAPYLLTDFVHLAQRPPVPLWFDALLLTTFSVTGLLVGYLALRPWHGWVAARAGAASGWAFVGAMTALTGLGVYIGRFLRWNSWDLATRPHAVLADLAERALAPQHHSTWTVTIALGSLCFAGYVALWSTPTVARGESRPSPLGADR